MCLLIFRGLAGIPYGAIWDWSQYISAVDYRHILLGALDFNGAQVRNEPGLQ